MVSNEKSIIAGVDAPPTDPDEIHQADLAARRRIRYAEDEEDGGPSSAAEIGHTLTRRASTYSIHTLSSVRSRRVIDASIILPVQYRTLSYDVNHVKAIERPKDAHEKTAVGMSCSGFT
jgi:hypothetical protein